MLQAPTGKKCVLLQGHRKAREAERHFGRAPGVPHSSTKYVWLSSSLCCIRSHCVACGDFCQLALVVLCFFRKSSLFLQAVCARKGTEVREGAWSPCQPWVQGLDYTLCAINQFYSLLCCLSFVSASVAVELEFDGGGRFPL